MAIEAGTKFLGIASGVDTKERRSKRINDKSEYHTIEDIAAAATAGIVIPDPVDADTIVDQLDVENFQDIATGIADLSASANILALQKAFTNKLVMTVSIVTGSLNNGTSDGLTEVVHYSSLKSVSSGQVLTAPTSSTAYNFTYNSSTDVLETPAFNPFSQVYSSVDYVSTTDFVENVYLSSNKIVIKVQDMNAPGPFNSGVVYIHLTQHFFGS